MNKAEDLWPLVAKLSRPERIRLARLALATTVLPESATDAERYRSMPVTAQEFHDAVDDPMTWESSGWEDVK